MLGAVAIGGVVLTATVTAAQTATPDPWVAACTGAGPGWMPAGRGERFDERERAPQLHEVRNDEGRQAQLEVTRAPRAARAARCARRDPDRAPRRARRVRDALTRA